MHRVLIAFVVLAGLAAAQDRAVVRRLGGPELKGEFAGVDPAGALQLRTPSGIVSVPADQMVAVVFTDGAAPAGAGAVRVDLVTGDVLFGQLEKGTYDDLTVSTAAAGPVTVLLDVVSQIVALDRAKAALLAPPRSGKDEDELFVDANGRLDRLPGELQRLDRGGAVFTGTGAAERTFSFVDDRVVMVRLAAAPPPEKKEGIVCTARTRDGGRLVGLLRGGTDGQPRLEMLAGPTVPLDRRALAALEFENAAFRFLSDLEPATLLETPFLEGGRSFGIGRDHGFGRDPELRIGGESYRRGLVLRARTVVGYELGGRFTSLSARVGVDPLTRDRRLPGTARLRVLGDGKELWKSPLLLAGDEAKVLELENLGEVSVLTLEADFGDSGPAGAWVVLGDALLRR